MSARCPSCRNKLVQKSAAETKIRVQGPITIGQDAICRGACFWCKAPVELPLELTKAFGVPSERFVIVDKARLVKSDDA